MHEFSICQAIVDQVEDVVRSHGAVRAEEITVAVGPLSGVEPVLLAEAFLVARRGVCADAELHLETAPVRIRCADCGAQCDCAANALLCANCGGHRTDLVGGDELTLLRVRLATAEAAIH